MPNDVTQFVKTYHECLLSSRKKKQISFGRQPVTSLFETFSVALAGILAKTKNGNRFIVVIVEHLSRCLIAKARPSQIFDEALTCFYENIMESFGSLGTIMSNQNPACMSGV